MSLSTKKQGNNECVVLMNYSKQTNLRFSCLLKCFLNMVFLSLKIFVLSLSLNFRRNLAENSFCNVDVLCILIGSSSSLGHPPLKWARVGVSITGGKNYQNSEIEMLDFFFPTCDKVAFQTIITQCLCVCFFFRKLTRKV